MRYLNCVHCARPIEHSGGVWIHVEHRGHYMWCSNGQNIPTGLYRDLMAEAELPQERLL